MRVERLQNLSALAVMSVDAAMLTSIEVTVARWSPPGDGWIGQPRVPGVTTMQIEPKGTGVVVHLGVASPIDASVLLAGCLRCLIPVPRGTGRRLTFAPGLPASAGMLAGRLVDAVTSGETRDAHVRRADVLVIPEGDTGADPHGPERATTVRVGATTWMRGSYVFNVCVDPQVQRPIGRRSLPATSIATASITGGVVTLTTDAERVILGRAVTASSARALRAVGAVIAPDLPVTVARQLNACGVLTAASADELPPADDALAWQVRSVHERRHALRQYGPTPALDEWPTVSVLLVTHRSDFLEHAFAQLRGLSYPHLQVVVGMHGDAVDAVRVSSLAKGLSCEVTTVSIDGTATLGEALQICSSRAEGQLITKMDDDDYYGPEHIWDLVLAREYSGATIVGKALDWIHLTSSDVTVFRPTYPAEKYARFVAGGTILISRADLADIGGWRPVPRSVDRALLDTVLDEGGLVYRTHGLGYIYVRRSSGHTATVRDDHFLKKVAATHEGLLRHEVFGTDR